MKEETYRKIERMNDSDLLAFAGHNYSMYLSYVREYKKRNHSYSRRQAIYKSPEGKAMFLK